MSSNRGSGFLTANRQTSPRLPSLSKLPTLARRLPPADSTCGGARCSCGKPWPNTWIHEDFLDGDDLFHGAPVYEAFPVSVPSGSSDASRRTSANLGRSSVSNWVERTTPGAIWSPRDDISQLRRSNGASARGSQTFAGPANAGYRRAASRALGRASFA